MAIRTLLSDLRPFYRFSPRNRALQARARRRNMQLESLESRQMMAADVSTDQEDYAPSATALISGSGFNPGEAIQLQVLHIDGVPNTGNGHDPWIVVDGGAGDLDGQADGSFQTTWYVDPDDSAGSTFELTAIGLSSGLTANDHFTDAADINAWTNQSSSWTSSVIQGSNSQYNEGATIPLRYVNTNLAAGSTHTVILKYDFSDGGSKRFVDSLGSFNASEPVTLAQLTSGISGLPAAVNYTIPTDGTLPVGAQNAGSLTTYNISSLTFGSYSLSSNVKAITLTYVVAGSSGTKNVLIGYGAHLASPNVWGAGNGAGYFPGASAKVYTRTDSESSDDQVSINPNGINSTPVANPDSYSTNEDTTLNVAAAGVLTNDTDGENSPLTATLVTGVSHGTLTLNSNGSFSYTPALNYTGTDSFTYKANDGALDSNVVTVTITVNPVNDVPVANPDSYSTNEDTTLTVPVSGVLGNDTDVEGSSLTAILVTGVSHGTLTLNSNGSFSYTPAANYTGTDSFTYKANDGAANSNTVTVTITVNPVNDAPVANPDSYSTNEDTTLTVPAAGVLGNDTDGDGNSLTSVLVTGVSHGTLTLNSNGSFSYTPAANYTGSDSFTYKANDGSTNSNTVTVTITVNPVNDAPVANPDSYSTNEDTTLTVPAAGVLGNDNDIDGNPLTSVLVTGVSHGTLTLNSNGSFSYTPAANYHGTDSFTYKANDGTADSNVVTVTITVNPTNDAPVASGDNYSTDEDTTLNIPAVGVLGNDGDTDNDPLTSVLVSDVSHGTLSLNADGSFDYTPDSNYHGTDSFTYKANDGTADSNVVTVTITVNPTNDAPVASGDNYSTDEDTTLNIPAAGVLGNDSDIDNDPLTSVLVSDVSHGTLSLNSDGSFDYTPDSNFHGNDSFTYKANDGSADSNVVTVTITINPTNDAPVASGDNYSTDEDTTLSIPAVGVLGNDGDIDSDPLTSVLVSDVSHGSLSLNADGSFDYTPDSNFHGTDSFTYKANDGTADSNIVTVTITVNPTNDAPVASGDNYNTDEDTTLNIPAAGVLGNDSDIDNDPLTSVLVSDVSHGTLSLNADGSFDYTPDANFHGTDSFTYKANDGTADSNIVTVTITVNSVNDAPIASPDNYTTDEDTPLHVSAAGVLDNDSDIDNDVLGAVLVTDVSHGALTLNGDGSFDYTPSADFHGTDSFTYKANDDLADSNIVTVTITVNPLNDAPVANPDSYNTNEDTTLVVSAAGVIGNDGDVDGDPLTASLVTGPSHGTLVFHSDGSFEYTPDANYNGADSFTYKLNDGLVDSNVTTVSLTINAVNDNPVANKDNYTTVEDKPLVIAGPGVLANDTDLDGDTLTVTGIVTPAAYGTVTIAANGSFTYTPSANFNGLDAFTYQVSDGHGGVATAKVKITVTPAFDLFEYLVVAADAGSQSKPYIKVYDVVSGSSPILVTKILAYEDSYRDGVRIAVGDVTGDDIPEIVAVPGRLRAPEVRVFNFLTGAELTSFRTMAYDKTFNKGLTVALGDVSGDGRNDIITSPTLGTVDIKVFKNIYTGTGDAIKDAPIHSFRAFPSSFIGGATVAAADMNGDGRAEVIVGSGSGMRPTVLIVNAYSGNYTPIKTFLPLKDDMRGGINVYAARVNRDATPDLVIASGPSGKSRVDVIDGVTGGILHTFRAYTDTTTNSPVRAALRDINNDGIIDFIYTGQGPDGRTRAIRRFNLTSPTPIGVDALLETDVNFTGGYFLG